MAVLYSAQSREDLADIADYGMRSWGEKRTRVLQAEFHDAFERILTFPDSGTLRRELGPDIRLMVVTPYLIFYKAKKDKVKILRILHGRSDLVTGLFD